MSTDKSQDQYLKDLRATGMGGSDATHYMNVAPCGCSRRIGYALTRTPRDYDDGPNAHMAAGSVLEAAIREEWCQRTGNLVMTPPTVRREDKPHLFVNLDGEIVPGLDHDGPGVLEIKSLSQWTWSRFLAEGVWEGYRRQMQHALMVTGYSWGAFAIHHRLPEDASGVTASLSVPMAMQEIVTVYVDRDEAMIAEQEAVCDALWADAQAGVLPPRKSEFAKACASCPWRLTCWEVSSSAVGIAEWESLISLYEESRKIAQRMSEIRRVLRQTEERFGVQFPAHPAMRRRSTTTNEMESE